MSCASEIYQAWHAHATWPEFWPLKCGCSYSHQIWSRYLLTLFHSICVSPEYHHQGFQRCYQTCQKSHRRLCAQGISLPALASMPTTLTSDLVHCHIESIVVSLKSQWLYSGGWGCNIVTFVWQGYSRVLSPNLVDTHVSVVLAIHFALVSALVSLYCRFLLMLNLPAVAVVALHRQCTSSSLTLRCRI